MNDKVKKMNRFLLAVAMVFILQPLISTSAALKLPKGYKALASPKGVKFKHVDVGVGGNSPQVIAIDTNGKAWQLNDNWKSWRNIHSAFAVEADDIPDGSTVAVWSHDESDYLITTYKGQLLEADSGNPHQHNVKLKVRRIGKWFAFERWDGRRLEYFHDDDDEESIQGFRRRIGHNLSERRCYYILVNPNHSLTEYDQRISSGALNNVAIKSVHKPSHFWNETSGATSLWARDDEHPAEYEDARFRIQVLSKGGALQPPSAMRSVSIGVDGAVWGASTDDRIWRKANRDAGWEQIPGPGRFVGVGRGNKVWVSNETAYERRNPQSGDKRVLYDPANWVRRGGSGIIGMGCLEDGTGFHYDKRGLYMYNRGWKPIQHPAGELARVAGKTRAEMVVVGTNGKVWRYSKKFDAASKRFKSKWSEAFSGLSMLDAAVGEDGTLVGITKDHQLVVKKVTAAEAERKRWIESEKGQGQAELKKIRNDTVFPITATPLEIVVKEKDSFDGLDLIMFRPLTLKGYAKDAVIKDFDAGKTLSLAPMLGKGFAWVSQAFKDPGKTTVSFVANARDQGDIQLVLDGKAGMKAGLKIIIGTQGNSKSVIELNGKVIAETSGKFSFYAKAMPGRNIPYWVSLNNDFIMVGSEQPGQNVFLCAYVPDLSEFTRFGFSSGKGVVDYSELQVGQAFAPHLVEESDLYKYEKAFSVGVSGKEKVTWIEDFPTRLPNEGTMICKVPGKEPVMAVLANDRDDAYKILFDQAKKSIVLMRNDVVITTCKTPPIGEHLWFSIDAGRIFAGQDIAGEEPLLAWEDQEMLENISKVGFMMPNKPYTVKSIGIGPSVPVGPDAPDTSYKAKIKRYPAKGDIQVLRPWHYVLTQKKLVLNIKDMISGRDYDAFQTSMIKGIYPFLLTIQEDGFPDIQPTADPQNKELKALDSAADRRQMKADRITRISNTVGEGVSQATGAAADLGPKGAAVAAAGAAVGAIAGTVGSLLAGGEQEKAEKYRKKAAEIAASRDMYVRLDKVELSAGAKGSIPAEVKQNRARVEDIVHDIDELIDDMPQLNADEIDDFVKRYKQLLLYVNHHYVLTDKLVRRRIHEGLNRLSAKLQKDEENEIYYEDPTYIKIMNLFAQAYSNVYLIDKTNKDEADMQEEWYFAMVDTADLLFRDLLEDKEKTLTIEPLYGEYLWLPMVFESEDIGAFGCEVKGQGDFMFCASESDERVRGSDVFLYEFVLGAFENSQHVIRVKSLGRSAAALRKKDNRKVMLAPGRFKKFHFVMNKDKFSIRHKGKVILHWKDPYAWGGIEFIGISTWQTPITIKNLDFKKCIHIDDLQDDEIDDEDWWGDE